MESLFQAPWYDEMMWLVTLIEIVVIVYVVAEAFFHKTDSSSVPCRACGYDLRATTGPTCPECGASKAAPADESP